MRRPQTLHHLRYENSRAESTGQQMADVDACWIGLSMALDGYAMTHEMFENRAFRDGGAYGESSRASHTRSEGARGRGQSGAGAAQSSHAVVGGRARGTAATTGPGSTRAPSRPPTTRSRAFTGICTGAGRATSRATGSRTHVRPLYTAATTRLPKHARWTSAQCDTPKPYVCTRRGTTEQHTLIVSNTLTLKDGGVLRGGGVVKPGTIVSNSDGYLDGAGLEASSLTTDLTGVHGAWLTYQARSR